MRSEPLKLSAARRWAMLGLGMAAQTVCGVFVNGAAFLIPALRTSGLTLAGAGLLVSMPTIGIVATLIAWGALADAIGERRVLAIGLTATALAGVGAALSSTHLALGVFLFLGGASAASANAASGRVVVGWFPPERRGLVMGIRQMAQPLGVGIAALTMPALAADHGVGSALLVPTVSAAVIGIACAVGVIDPPRPQRSEASAEQIANPYRANSLLWRIHGVSVLLVVPQFVVWTYALVWLVSDRHWGPGAAGVLITVAQILGAIGRVTVGAWSDRVGSRLGPLRWVAAAASAVMAALALTDALGSSLSVVLLVLATVVTVADNGLAFTSVAEIGGPFWAGRALGAQNTAQFLAGAAVPPVMGVLIAGLGFPVTFLITAVLPALAVPLVPRAPGR